jgi:hypothetical protein
MMGVFDIQLLYYFSTDVQLKIFSSNHDNDAPAPKKKKKEPKENNTKKITQRKQHEGKRSYICVSSSRERGTYQLQIFSL